MPAEMTLRDHFAAAALTGLLAQGDDGSFSEESYVRAAYRWADAMLRCRAGGDCPGQDNAPKRHGTGDTPVTEPMPKGKRAEVSVSEPVAWAVMDGHEFMEFCTDREDAKCAAGFYGDYPIIPLYRKPQPTLTDAERDAIDEAAVWYEGVDDDERCRGIAATLRGLLERLK